MIEKTEPNTMPAVAGLLLKTDGTCEEKTFESYQDLRDSVGGWIEGIDPLRTPVTEFTWRGYVNEEGRIIGLPENVFGSVTLTEMGWTGGALAGDIVVVGPTDQWGWDTDLDPEVKAAILDSYDMFNYLRDGFVVPEIED